MNEAPHAGQQTHRPKCLSEEQLRAFQLGQLSDGWLDAIAQHLELCPHCESLAQHLDMVVDPMLAAIRCSKVETPRQLSSPDDVSGPPGITVRLPSLPALRPPQQRDEMGRLGNYRILRLLGQGGMAYVFEAEDLTLHRPVALKVMRQDLDSAAESSLRFVREARIMAAIRHENLATVFQAGQDETTVFLAMELLKGESLDKHLERGVPLPLDEVMRIARAVAQGLAAVHRHGLIHRDIKPGNIWIEAPSGQVKILDFGLARFIKDDANLTQPGLVIGTPAYMSPEQANGLAVDARSDLFSLGCVLYWACTGVKAFGGDSVMTVLSQLATHTPPPVHERNPAIPRELSDLVTELLAKAPTDRPRSAEAVIERLSEMEAAWRATPPRPRWRFLSVKGRRHLAPWVALVLILGLAAVLIGGRGGQYPGAQTAENPKAADRVYLINLPLGEVVNWPFPGPIHGPPRRPEPADWPAPQGGQRVIVRGEASPHGIWMHLPTDEPEEVRISYRLQKQFRSFHTKISLNDGPPECIPLTFEVLGDGRRLWQSRPVLSQNETQECSISVKDVETLTLRLTGSGDSKGTHAVWIEPYLTK